MGKMPSVMQHQFSQIPKAEIPRSVFNRTHAYKTTFDSGYLIPFYVDEALPGDTFNLNATIFARLATPIVPFMDNLYCDTFYFAVPLRLVWSNFQKFMGEQANPDDSIDFLTPQIVAPASVGWAPHSLSDYFGLPVGIPGISVCSFWHRAYNLIWNEWFRDQNLQDSVVVDKDDGADTNSDYVLLKRGKRHDYFTSALLWPQKGDAVELPLGDTAPVIGIAKYTQTFGWGSTSGYDSAGDNVTYASCATLSGDSGGNAFLVQQNGTTGYPNIHVDLSDATGATINSLREAFQLQKLLERDARAGTRYTEKIKSHFGVTSPDARLQRPEFLCGTSSPIMITPVAQMSATGATGTPQGNLAGFGTLAHRDGFTKSFTEHCVIIGMLSVRADLTYQQGIPRMFSRRTQYDFYWPALANLGEQAILNKEIYAQATTTTGDAGDLANNGVFGYQERWAEYRYYPSKITGKLRSNWGATANPVPLDVWHLSQEFESLPALDETFIKETPPLSRVVAVDDEPQFVMDSFISCKCVRPMPTYSVPGLIDHF